MKPKIILATLCALIAASGYSQNLFVSENNGPGIISEFTLGGARSTFASGVGYPQGLAFNSAGDLFEGDGLSHEIFEFTPGGTKSTFAAGELSGAPGGLAFNSAGNLFVSNPGELNIIEITPGGTGSAFASLSNPAGLAFDSRGNLFVAVWAVNGSIVEITPGGVQSTFASGLYDPQGLAFDSAGNLFEADTGSGKIYKFTPSGVRSTFASGLYYPFGLAFNSAGDLFVTSAGNPIITSTSGNILEFTPSGVQSTFVSGLSPFQQTFLAFQPVPPDLRIISQSNGAQFVIRVGGVLGQTIVLQSSPDLQNWLPFATNTLTSTGWNYTNNVPQNCNEQFYRAQWLQ